MLAQCGSVGLGRVGPQCSLGASPSRRPSALEANALEASMSLRLAIQANSRPRETTADRSAAALELAAQLEADAGGPTEDGPSGADALLAQYVTWVMPHALGVSRCCLGSATAHTTLASWGRLAMLEAVLCARNKPLGRSGPSGRLRCGCEARPMMLILRPCFQRAR